MNLELIETEIELNIIKEETLFNIYLCKETLNIFAKEICEESPRTIQFRIKRFFEDEYKSVYKNNKANLDYAMLNKGYEYLTYRLGRCDSRYIKEEEVTIGDVFMFGDYEQIGGIL